MMSNPHNDGYYEAYWPRAARQQRTRQLAPRLATLEGKTVAQLWDYLFKGDRVFELLEAGLKARFPGVKFVSWRISAPAGCGRSPPVARNARWRCPKFQPSPRPRSNSAGISPRKWRSG